jgi:predicted ATPase/DNA-binding winged helix-turn-helix (wHTH) protein
LSENVPQRPHPFFDGEISFGEFRLYPARRLLLHAGAPVPLGGRAFMLLLALVEQAGELVGKEALIARVWPGTSIEENNLQAQVAALRRALGRHSDGRYIATVSGRGYSFVAPVSVTSGSTTVPRPPEHNLIDRVTRVIGREVLIEELGSLLADRRLITLTGPGGIGKTTVALETARQQLNAYADGVWLVDLAPVLNPALLPAAVASTLGLAVLSDDATQALIGFLQDKRMLIVLDSCEQAIEAAARLAETILRRAPGLRLIATSREPLGAEGEWVKRLAPLETPPVSAGLTATEALDWPAVQLFVERAAANLEAFKLSDDDAPIVAEICRRLDGVALAIELGAGQIEAFGVRGLLSLLDEHFLLLMRGRRTALARHQTLNATLEWSYRHLPDEERRLLRRLGVLVGDFTLVAACGVAADRTLPAHAIADLLAGLVAKSLVSAQVAGPIPRFRLLDTTRAYALQQLREASEFEATARRHARFIREGLDAAGEAPACEAPACGPDNLRTALDWAHANDAETAVALTLGALGFWFSMGLIEECRVRVEQAIPLVEASPAGDRAMMRLQGALMAVLMNTHGAGPELERVSRRVLALAETVGEVEHLLRALWGLWAVRADSGRHREALEIARQFAAVAAQPPASAPAHAFAADRMLGVSSYYLGDHEAALAHLDRALAACPRPERSTFNLPYHFDQRITALGHRARVLLIRGCPDQAMRTAAAAATEARAIGHMPSLVYTLSLAACPVAIVTGDLDLAQTYVDLLVEGSRDLGMQAWRTLGRFYGGWLRSRRGDSEAALTTLSETFAELRANRFGPVAALALAQAAASVGEAGAVRESMAALDVALARAELGEERWCHPELLRVKAELIVRQDGPGALALARMLLQAAGELARGQGALCFELRAATSLARLEARSPSGPATRAALAQVLARFREGFETSDLALARRLLDSGGASPARCAAAG